MLGWTGIGRYTGEVLARLPSLSPDDEFVVLVRGDAPLPAPGLRPVAADIRPYSLNEQRHLGALVRRLRPDLVHFTHVAAPARCPVPYVVTVHDLTMLRFRNVEGTSPAARLRYEAKFRAQRPVVASLLRHARLVMTGSRHVADDVAATFSVPPARLRPVPLAAEVDRARGDPAPPAFVGDPARSFLLYVGNFYPHKNVGTLVRAMAPLWEGRPDLALVLAGPSDYFQRRLQAEVGDRRVLMPGRVGEEDLEWLYRHAAAFVFPSRSEGFGLPGLEAMARGLPVVAARATCLPEVYGDAAAWFDPDDPADLARVVRSVLDDGDRRQELARAGPVQAARYRWADTAAGVLAAYRQAVAGPA